MNKLPQFPEFAPVSLDVKKCLNKYFEKYQPEICELNLGNLLIWKNYDRPKFTIINNNLCLLCEPTHENRFFYQPIGENKIEETLDICLSYAPKLSRAEGSFVQKYASHLKAEPDRDNFDYVYLSQDLIELKGKKYDGKRNRIKKFSKSHEYSYIKLEENHFGECEALFEEWLKSKNYEKWIEDIQRESIKQTVKLFNALNLTGGAIMVNGKIEAFSVGEKLNNETAVIHFEFASPHFEGLSQVINSEFVKNEWSGFKFINREQDLGIPGLRRAKLSYYPDHLVEKFDLRK